MQKRHILIGLFLTITLFVVHVVIMNDYGLTWDFHHHFFAGLHLLGRPMTDDLTRYIPFTRPDPRLTNLLPFGPLMSIAPTASYMLFFENLKLLAFDNAYNLAIIASGVTGIFILYLFLLEAFDFPTALAGLTFLALLPRYFGDLHNNMKDVPQSAAFALAVWFFWRLVRYRKIKHLILASIAFAIAFNTKVNTLAVPMIAASWLILLWLLNHKKRSLRLLTINYQLSTVLSYFILAPLFAFLLWSYFWSDPIGQLLYIPRFFYDNTINLEVLYFGKIYRSGVNAPWHYPFGYLAITTPLPTLIFFLGGIFFTIRALLVHLKLSSRLSMNHELSTKLLFILWFLIPLTRYLSPQMGVIDGIRHFEEVVYPLAGIAAIGAVSCIRFLKSIKLLRSLIATLIIGTPVYLLSAVVSYHPFQISYYNELVGGLRGALGRFDVEYWGTSQKKAMTWINANARKGSTVHVVMAADVAAKYLRPDLLPPVNNRWYDSADFVVVLNRQSFFDRYYGLKDYMMRHKPVYGVFVQGVPTVLVYDNSKPQELAPYEWWHLTNLPKYLTHTVAGK